MKKETPQDCSGVKPLTVVVTECNSTIEKLSANAGIRIYPNPASEIIIIENTKISNSSIVNSKGTKVILNSLIIGKNEFQLTSLASGIYAIVLEKDEKYYSVRFVKQ